MRLPSRRQRVAAAWQALGAEAKGLRTLLSYHWVPGHGRHKGWSPDPPFHNDAQLLRDLNKEADAAATDQLKIRAAAALPSQQATKEAAWTTHALNRLFHAFRRLRSFYRLDDFSTSLHADIPFLSGTLYRVGPVNPNFFAKWQRSRVFTRTPFVPPLHQHQIQNDKVQNRFDIITGERRKRNFFTVAFKPLSGK